jgi:malonate-semialdehyde dehydrogenase (acetylating)/methylmalonate-semialdehyde dehydrogenase
MKYEVGHFIDGEVTAGESGRWGEIAQPATGEIQARVAFASADEVDRAVASASRAFEEWSNVPVVHRAAIMFRVRELLHQHLDELNTLVVREHGKVWGDARGELGRGFEVVDFACGIPHLLKGEFSEQVGTGIDSWSVRQPLGVVAAITPFNFPAMLPLWTLPIAIACGNTFVLKPSEKDPSCSLRLAELFHEAGVPDGVFNVVNGDRVAVDRLLEHPDLAAISFVGSTPVAEHVYRTGCANNKRVQALGGAKNHAVVMPDADLDQAADALIGAAYGSAGERCMAISAAVAVGDVGDALVERLEARVRALKVGDGMDSDSEMGPLVTRAHLERVEGYIARGVEEGAELVVDGRELRAGGDQAPGFFLGGTLFDRVTPEMSIYRDEIFGPVLPVLRVRNFDEALALVNDHEFGNGAAIFTRDGDVARTFANRVKAGMVGLNIAIPVPLAFHSFGGWKRSLFGSSNIYGLEGVRFFTRVKTMTSRWPSGALTGPNLEFPSSS